MTEFIAFQQFIPHEQNNENRCIWCKKVTPKNRAHIISRRLSTTSHPSTVLRYGVCKECNSKCSEIEMWILRNTPLGWIRFFLYPQSNRMSNTNAIPSYFYASDLKEWLVYKGEGGRSYKTINSQLYLSDKDGLQLIAEKSPEEEADKILESMRNHSYITDVRSTLPDDFSPRALIDGHTVLV